MPKARVSCDASGGRAQRPRFDHGPRASGARSWRAGSCRGSDERKVLCTRGADEVGVACRKRKGLSLRQLQVARVIDAEPVLAGERHDPRFLWSAVNGHPQPGKAAQEGGGIGLGQPSAPLMDAERIAHLEPPTGLGLAPDRFGGGPAPRLRWGGLRPRRPNTRRRTL